MRNFLFFSQIAISILLMIAILIQAKGTGLGTSFGGSGEFYRSKRGLEKVTFYITVLLVILFMISSILNLVF